MISGLEAERQVLGDAVYIRRINRGGLAKTPETLGVFGLSQVAAASAGAHDLAGGGDFKPLGHRFLRFDAFGTSHKFNSIAKERGI
jgi:hypothetical protein